MHMCMYVDMYIHVNIQTYIHMILKRTMYNYVHVQLCTCVWSVYLDVNALDYRCKDEYVHQCKTTSAHMYTNVLFVCMQNAGINTSKANLEVISQPCDVLRDVYKYGGFGCRVSRIQ